VHLLIYAFDLYFSSWAALFHGMAEDPRRLLPSACCFYL